MKICTPLIFLLGLACGRVNLPADSKLSTFNSLTQESMKPGSKEYEHIKSICDALDVKSLTIDSLVSTNYVFSNTAKNCTEANFANLGDTSVSLVNQLGLFKFTEGNNLFYFSDVETNTQGVLSTICKNLSDLKSPIDPTANNLVYFTTTNVVTSDCAPATNEMCIKIENAVKQVSGNVERGRVHTREWIRVNLTEPRRGFFTYRKKISEASCAKEEFLGRTATLK